MVLVAHSTQSGLAWFGIMDGHLVTEVLGPSTTNVMDANHRSHTWCPRCVATCTRQVQRVAVDGLQGGCPFGSSELCHHDFKKRKWSYVRLGTFSVIIWMCGRWFNYIIFGSGWTMIDMARPCQTSIWELGSSTFPSTLLSDFCTKLKCLQTHASSLLNPNSISSGQHKYTVYVSFQLVCTMYSFQMLVKTGAGSYWVWCAQQECKSFGDLSLSDGSALTAFSGTFHECMHFSRGPFNGPFPSSVMPNRHQAIREMYIVNLWCKCPSSHLHILHRTLTQRATSLGVLDPFPPSQEKLPKSSQGEPRLVEATEAIGSLPFQSKGFAWFASRFDLPEKFHPNHPQEQQVSFQTSQVGIRKPPTPSLMYEWEAMLCWLGMWGSKTSKASRFERMHIDGAFSIFALCFLFASEYAGRDRIPGSIALPHPDATETLVSLEDDDLLPSWSEQRGPDGKEITPKAFVKFENQKWE